MPDSSSEVESSKIFFQKCEQSSRYKDQSTLTLFRQWASLLDKSHNEQLLIFVLGSWSETRGQGSQSDQTN